MHNQHTLQRMLTERKFPTKPSESTPSPRSASLLQMCKLYVGKWDADNRLFAAEHLRCWPAKLRICLLRAWSNNWLFETCCSAKARIAAEQSYTLLMSRPPASLVASSSCQLCHPL